MYSIPSVHQMPFFSIFTDWTIGQLVGLGIGLLALCLLLICVPICLCICCCCGVCVCARRSTRRYDYL